MEMQSPMESDGEFSPGTEVVYALHGRCNLVAVETKQVGGNEVRFYRLEIQKTSLSRTTRQDPTIWLPVATAKTKGLRAPMNARELEDTLSILNSREYYFQPDEYWHTLYPKLEECIRLEGARGLAKVASLLHVLKQRHVVLPTEIQRFSETVNRLLYRELSIALNEPMKSIEERTQKGLRLKIMPNN